VKDNLTKTILLVVKSENGLYLLQFRKGSIKTRCAAVALLGIRIFSLIWHFKLGHPSTDIVSRVVNAFHLPISNTFHSNKIIVTPPKLALANPVESLAIYQVEPTCGQIGNRPYKNYQSKYREGE
jgi:hypothetical protein